VCVVSGTGRFVPEDELARVLLLITGLGHALVVMLPDRPVPVGKIALPDPVGPAGELPLVKAYGAVTATDDEVDEIVPLLTAST